MSTKNESKGETADFVFLECDADHSFEKSANNSRWINRIDGGLELPENSKLSVQYAGINIRGSGTDVIEFKGKKVGDSEFYEYDETTSKYVKNKYEVYDNKVTLQIEFYKNQDGLYNFPIPFPAFDYPLTDYETVYRAIGNAKDVDLQEEQYGMTSSDYQSIYNYAFPIDNKRYTILKRDPNSIWTGDEIGRTVNGLIYERDQQNFQYSIFYNKVEIEIDKGFVSPSSVAEQISQQLEKHGPPTKKKMRCYRNTQDQPGDALGWGTDYKDILGGLTCETEIFKLFNCATRRTYYTNGWGKWVEGALGIKNNDEEVQQYQKNFEYIGCYNPELFLYARSILQDIEYASYQKNFVFLNTIDCSTSTQEEFKEYDMFTSIPYDEAILSQYDKVFKLIRNDPEFYETKVGKLTSSTNLNSVFLHVDCLERQYPDLKSYKKQILGTDNNIIDFVTKERISNPLYLTWDSSYTGFSDTNAYGVFHRWKADDGNFYAMVKGRFYIKMTAAKPGPPPVASAPYFEFYTLEKDKYGGTFGANAKEAFKPATFPIATVDYSRIGWDCHFSAHGNQSIMLWNGMGDYSALTLDIVHTGQNPPTPVQHQIYKNQFTIPSEVGKSFPPGPKYWDYDTGNDQIYLGADNFLFNFDDTESRFNISQLHTARKQYNNAMSGFDPSILTGISVEAATGNPEIYFASSLVDGGKVAFPLTDNPNANTAIYEVSPTDLQNGLQEVSNKNVDMKANTVFDSNCGIFIGNFGLSDANFKNSLWDILGFSNRQTKTYMVDPIGEQIMLNRNNRFLNLGVNLQDTPVYPYTSNAQINSNEIISWKANPFSSSYFNTLNIPNNFRMLFFDTGNAKWDYRPEINKYRIVQNQESTLMYADVLPSKSNIPFYQVRSDIIPLLKYYGGDEQTNGRLPVVAIVNKSMAGADYFVNQGDNSMEYIIKKRITINTVTTEIFDNFGRPALLDDHSSVIFRIQVPYNEPNVTPFNNLAELEQEEQEKEKK